jgi:transposase
MSQTPPVPPSEGSSDQPLLFEIPPETSGRAAPEPEPEGGRPRLRVAERGQVTWRPLALDQVLSEEHRARLVWQYVEGLDLGRLYEQIAAVEGHVGRSSTDPKILMALWLYATLEGVGAARELDRLCRDHVAYQWICGGVSMNYHTIADFRTAHGELLDELLTVSVATLLHQDMVDLKRVAQDGMRVRAGAGSGSFHRRATLERCLREAKTQVEALRQELRADPAAASRRQQAARERAGRERTKRIERALEELAKVERQKAERAKRAGDVKPSVARASTTDPQARRMKMADGGFRPAYNVQLATATCSQVIVGVKVTNAGGDGEQMTPMVEQIEARYGEAPCEWLVDGGFATRRAIEEVSAPERGTMVYAPVKEEEKKRAAGVDPFASRPRDSTAVAVWRVRMGTEEAKTIYKERAATAECVNAIARNRGLYQFRVRGLKKVLAVVLWYALAHNLMRGLALLAAAKPMTA